MPLSQRGSQARIASFATTYEIEDTRNMDQGSASLAHEQLITVCALIHRDFDGVRKVFLPKRASTKKFLSDVYELPGGHVDFGEDLVNALKREIMEEFGMRINVGDTFGAFTYINEVKHSHSVEIIYFATFADPLEKIALNLADHSKFIWVSIDDIDKAYTSDKIEDDKEFVVVRQGLELLNNGKLSFG